MAIDQGVGPHFAYISTNGGTFPIEHGSVEQHATRKSSSFSATIPLSYPGAEGAFSSMGENETSIFVESVAGAGQLVTGEIDCVDISYVKRLINVTGRCKSAKLHNKKSSEKWQNKKGHEIVTDLAGRVGLGVQTDQSMLQAGKLLQQDYIKLSDNVSYSYILHKLAEFDGARWWVDAQGILHYLSMANPQGIYTLHYVPPTPGSPMAGDFLDLRIKRNIQAGKTIQVTVKSWHPKDKKVYEHVSNVPGNGGPLEFNYHIPNLKQDHVEQHAKSRAKEHARHEITVDAHCVGDPSCNPAMDLVIEGTGVFDQSYQMDCVHHQFGMSGYTMSITAKSGKSGREAD